jgi:hypothetical protein
MMQACWHIALSKKRLSALCNHSLVCFEARTHYKKDFNPISKLHIIVTLVGNGDPAYN